MTNIDAKHEEPNNESPAEPKHPDDRTCLGCGVEVPAGEMPPCGH